MPKNIVIIDDDKAEIPAPEDLITESATSYDRVPPPSDLLLQTTELSVSKKPNILRGSKPSIAPAPVTTGSKPGAGGSVPVATGVQRLVTFSAADASQTPQSHSAIITTATGPRSVLDNSLGLCTHVHVGIFNNFFTKYLTHKCKCSH